LEIMITLAILGVVLSLLYLTFNQSMKVMADAGERAEIIQQGRLLLEKMTAEIKNSFLSPQGRRNSGFRYGLIGQTSKEGEYFRDRLDFTSLVYDRGGSRDNKGEILEIGYFLDHEPGGRRFTLFRRQDEAVDGDLLRGGRILPLGDGVRGLSFLFFDRQGVEQKEWNSLEGIKRNELPARVEIHLTLEDAQGQIHNFRSQTFLPLAGEKG